MTVLRTLDDLETCRLASELKPENWKPRNKEWYEREHSGYVAETEGFQFLMYDILPDWTSSRPGIVAIMFKRNSVLLGYVESDETTRAYLETQGLGNLDPIKTYKKVEEYYKKLYPDRTISPAEKGETK
jgi:hypothetical protein